MQYNALIALALTTLAGLSTGIGGVIAVLIKRPNDKVLSAALGFSAGIMLALSLGDMLPHGASTLIAALGRWSGGAAMLTSILTGCLLSIAADKLAPGCHHIHNLNERSVGMHRLGLLTAVAVCIHNLPEGIATFMSSYSDVKLGLPLALSVALHNIPEGMAVAMPILYATNSRTRAIGYAFASGVSEPVGAIITYLFLRPYMSDLLLALVFGVIVGLMCYISLDELIPSALSYNHPYITLAGLLIGVLIMSGSILAL